MTMQASPCDDTATGPERGMAGEIWREIRVHYHGDRDQLVLGGVRPLLTALAGHVSAAYFTRHWKQGPHLRIPVRASAGTWRDVVEPAARAHLGGFLRAYPSATHLDPQRLLAAHQRLAEREHEDGPLLPWQPDNTVLFSEHDRRIASLGSAGLADLLADYYTATNATAFAMMEHAPAYSARRALAFDLMVATAHRMYPPVTLGFVSFRSHAEAFLAQHDAVPPAGGGRLRAEFDAVYQKQAPRLTARVGEVLSCLSEGSPVVPFVKEWVGALEPYRVRGAELLTRGDTPLGWGGGGDTGAAWVSRSPMHQLMTGSDKFTHFMRTDPPLRAYRLVLNFTYLHLARIGLTEADRYLLCHLAANAVEERYGVSAIERAADVAGHGAPKVGSA